MTTTGPWRKARRSQSSGSACVEARLAGEWRKSSRSQSNGSACVETRLSGATPQLSDSKLAHDRPILTLSPADYLGLLDALRSGKLSD